MASRWSTLTSSKTAVYNTCQIAIPQQSSLVKDLRLLQRIRNNTFTHFAESWRLSFIEMHGEKVGVVSCYIQQTNIVWTLETLLKHLLLYRDVW